MAVQRLTAGLFWVASVALSTGQALASGVFATAVDLNTGALIEYEIRADGYAVWGDIGIGKAADIARYGLRLPQPLSRSDAAQDENKKYIQQNYFGRRLWTLPIAYHVSDPTLAPLIEPAIADLMRKTVLKFVPHTTEADYIEFVEIPGTNSVSHGVGNSGGMHLIELGDSLRSGIGTRYGIVQHEILHALGFGHEHQRKDRDEYIEIHFECIEPDFSSQYSTVFDTVPFGKYDFASVMHYDVRAYATSDQCRTFTVKPGKDANVNVPNCTQHFIGQWCAVSPGDIEAINFFYGPQTVLDVDQHGLTGSWYEPATSGQGLLLEIFPNLSSPGTGAGFIAWFTYDTVLGGAERQRWYTLQGPMIRGQRNAPLTIYRNTGGNFSAPPATESQAIGVATLTFTTCYSGQLAYTFTDGSGRAGVIPLTRLLPNVTCSPVTSTTTNTDFAFSGSWYAGPATSGQGFMVDVAPSINALFMAWFTYAPNGANAGAAGQRWYTAQGAFRPGLRIIPVQIFETTGGMFDSPTPAGQQTVPVGTGTMTFQSCSSASFSYTFTGGSSNGQSGILALARVGPVPTGCIR